MGKITSSVPIARMRPNRRPHGAANVKPRRSLRKLLPGVKLPSARVLRTLTPSQRMALTRATSTPLECVYQRSFSEPNADKKLLVPLPEIVPEMARGGDADRAVGGPLTKSLLTADEERQMFMRYNFCRHRMMRVLRAYAGRRLTARPARELLRWEAEASDTRETILLANLGLVPAMLKRSKIIGVDFSDLISEGQMAVLRSVDKFDCSRGFKFSTYACRAVLSSFSRSLSNLARERRFAPTEFNPGLESGDDTQRKRGEDEVYYLDALKNVLSQNEAELNPMELRIIDERFGFSGQPPRGRGRASRLTTLSQIARVVGLTRERVRQIQNDAIAKIQGAVRERTSPN